MVTRALTVVKRMTKLNDLIRITKAFLVTPFYKIKLLL